ncbi:MAG: hypothetical protein QM610_10390 [Chitinophagaceae bacterium]
MSPLLEKVSRFSPGTITILLLFYGIFVAIGNLFDGKGAGSNPVKVLMKLFILLVAVFIGLYFSAPYKIGMIVSLAGMGFFAFSIVPGMQLYVLQLAEKHLSGTEDVASSLNIAAFNIGIATGSYACGLLVTSSFGIQSISLASARFVFIAFLLSVIGFTKQQDN